MHVEASKEKKATVQEKTSMSLVSAAGSLGGHAGDYRDPAISPDGEPTTTTPLADVQRQAHESLAAKWNPELEKFSAEEILDWADEHVAGSIAVTMSMQDTVLAELAEGRLRNAELVFLDTGYHFDETIQTRDQVAERYRLPLRNVTPTLSRKEQDKVYGPRLYLRDNTACCRMRKVEPLARMLNPFTAWVTGIRRVDSALRANTPVLEVDRTGRLKINPIVTWTDEQVESYIQEHDLIINPLTKQGYPSIGCATCTLPVAEGEDPRSGRWAGSNKTECGLHT
ncbi:adenosine phosphosulfate reductase [Corynebacterium resistens DSM 45100]|uniref:Adenosine 5'-phosphosulfate reductase n=2 Tax=Corynebacterium resistens TaxID=258224 RepID=F8E1K1_CORRG|nr:adenosine phosphosulfate reductase [Corynebacterium resistens DSM 45100]